MTIVQFWYITKEECCQLSKKASKILPTTFLCKARFLPHMPIKTTHCNRLNVEADFSCLFLNQISRDLQNLSYHVTFFTTFLTLRKYSYSLGNYVLSFPI